MSFKIGDKVRFLTKAGWGDHIDLNSVYEVVDNVYPSVKHGKVDIACVTMFARDFELVEEEKKMFTKSDLKTGMRVVHRNGEVGIVVKDLDVIIFKSGRNSLQNYTEDLLNSVHHAYDISEVHLTSIGYFLDLEVLGDLLWKREEKSPEQIEAEAISKEISVLQSRLDELSKKL